MLSGSFPPTKCGVADYTLMLCQSLRDSGLEISVITTAEPAVVQSNYLASGLQVFPVISKWGFTELPKIFNILRNTKPDLVHIQYVDLPFQMSIMVIMLPMILKLFGRHPVITTIHEVGAPGRRFSKRFLGNLLYFSKKVIVTNGEHLSWLRRNLPLDFSKVVLVPIGASILALTTNTRVSEVNKEKICGRWNIDPNSTLLSFFGFILEGKGIEVLFLALKQLLKQNLKVKLVMIGGINDIVGKEKYCQSMQELANNLEIGNSVVWTGFCSDEDASRLLRISDICVLPYDEGLSMRRGTFITAISYGLPTISTTGKNLPPEIKNGENVLLVPPKDPTRLAEAIIELSSSQELRKKLSQQARRLANSYSWENISKQTIKVYCDCLKTQK